MLGLTAVLGGGAQPASAATTITVDCTADPSALASALTTATDGDTLAIQGTCTGTFEISHSRAHGAQTLAVDGALGKRVHPCPQRARIADPSPFPLQTRGFLGTTTGATMRSRTPLPAARHG
jgi:hypothetical protein